MELSRRGFCVAGSRPPSIAVAVDPAVAVRAALGVLLGLLAVNLVCILAVSGSGWAMTVVAKAFLFDGEANLPTLFSVSLLAGNAALAALNGLVAHRTGGRWRLHWIALAVILALLAFDEAAALHERLGVVGRMVVEPAGILFFAWVVPGAAIALAVAIGFLRFVLALDPALRGQVMLAGALYLGGALGVELWGASHASVHGMRNDGFMLICTVEETLEMLGQIVLAHALMQSLARPDGRIGFEIDRPALPAPAHRTPSLARESARPPT
jgi:hypothetical protein